MKRILIVSVNWLGDAIMLTPACKALKRVPSYVAVAAHPRIVEVFNASPYVDETIAFDERGAEKSVAARISFARKLGEKKFDTVFLVHRSFTRALICMAAGIPRRIGFARAKTFFVVNDPVTPDRHIRHRQDAYLDLFEKAGVALQDKMPEVFVPAEAVGRSKVFFSQIPKGKFLVGVNVSANWEMKRWEEANWAQLCDRLVRELDCTIVFIGAPRDKGTVDAVRGQMKESSVDLCGKTSITELAAAMQHIDLFISGDSGPAHLSAAMGASTLVLFGPTDPEVTGPRGKRVTIITAPRGTDCVIPCYDEACRDARCMKAISGEAVFLQAKKILTHAV